MPKISPRIVELEHLIRLELQGLQLGRETKETVFGTIDVPLLGTRFRVTEPNAIEDQGWRVLLIPNKDLFDPEQIFLVLAEQGLLHYLRERVSSHQYLLILQSRNRWQVLLEYIISTEETERTSPYKVKQCKQLLRRPLTTLLFENPGVFDWIA
jgi:hypothetical protein